MRGEAVDYDGEKLDLTRLRVGIDRKAKKIQNEMYSLELSDRDVFYNIDFSNVDFSKSTFNAVVFKNCRFQSCVFSKVKFSSVKFIECEFTECSLVDAAFKDCLLGPSVEKLKLNAFTKCEFINVKFKDVLIRSAVFRRCLFSRSIKNIDFGLSIFNKCKFVGDMEDIMFYGFECTEKAHRGELLEVDFSMAHFKFVGFKGLNLDQVVFPKNSKFAVLQDYNNFLKSALNELDSIKDKNSAELLLGRFLKINSPKTSENYKPDGFIDLGELETELGQEVVSSLVKLESFKRFVKTSSFQQ